MSGIKSAIFAALKTRLQGVTGVKSVTWDRIRITESDFADHELPAIQFYGLQTLYAHEQGRVTATTQIAIEVVLRGGSGSTQATLLDLMEAIEQKVGEDPSLGIPQMIHMAYVSDEIDLHSIEPFYIGRLNFEALYHKPYTKTC